MRTWAIAALGLLTGWVGACGGGEPHDEHDEHEEEGEHGHAEPDRIVRIRPEAAERANIELAEAPPGGLPHMVEVPAEVELDPDRMAHISPIVEGRIEEVHAAIGDRVARGDVLVVLRSVAVGETRAAIAEVGAALREAEEHFGRQQQLVAEGIGAERNLEEAQKELETVRARMQGLRQRAQLYGNVGSGGRTVIRSPIDGEVLSRHATIGEVAPGGRTLFEIADLSEVWIMGDVFAQDVASVRPGAEAVLTLRSGGQPREGTLDYVAPALDEHTRTLPVRMVLPNEADESGDRPLRPGLFGTLHVESATDVDTTLTAIPTEAVQPLDDEPHVFVPGESESEYRAIPVRTGRTSVGRVEILEGLSPGDTFVTRGAFVLRSEIERDQMGHGHGH